MKWKAKNIQRHKYDQVIWNIFHRTSRLAVNEHIYASIWVYWVRWIGFIYCLLVNTFAHSERRNWYAHFTRNNLQKSKWWDSVFVTTTVSTAMWSYERHSPVPRFEIHLWMREMVCVRASAWKCAWVNSGWWCLCY